MNRADPTAKAIKLSDSAASAIEVDVVENFSASDWPEERRQGYRLLRDNFRQGKLHLPDAAADRNAMADAINDLSNTHDDLSREPSASAHERRFAARAASSLATLVGKTRAALSPAT